MPTSPVKGQFPVPMGPFELWPTLNAPPLGRVRVSQHYVEIVHSGSSNKVRLSQQYLEILHSGGSNKIRLSQQYLEVVHSFNSLPPGKSGGAPGHNKPPQARVDYLAFVQRERRYRNKHAGRFSNPNAVIYSRAYLPQNPVPIRYIDEVKTVRIT